MHNSEEELLLLQRSQFRRQARQPKPPTKRLDLSLAGNSILRFKALSVALEALKLAGVHGIVERRAFGGES